MIFKFNGIIIWEIEVGLIGCSDDESGRTESRFIMKVTDQTNFSNRRL